ncbi:MAG: DUF4886 domain-containing protein [Victivallaceae bacterium]|nr:DUF4886 domain-containing protein [Victivallaceae bacterium]
MKILTIGNSFSDNATFQLSQMIALESNLDLTIGRASLGGCSLEKHWNLVEQSDLLPNVKPYDFHILGETSTPMNLREILATQKWDYVTLQQVSHCSWRPETFGPYIGKLYALIKELAPQAEIVLHQTWAYRIDDEKYFTENSINQMAMHRRIVKNYQVLAERLNCSIIPSGVAIQQARGKMNFVRDSNFDYANPKPLELPDECKSLNIGHIWKTGNTPSGKPELVADYRHLNEKGCYIANAVWFEMFTGKNIADNSFCPAGVSEEELKLFKEAAHQTVIEKEL